MLIERSFLAVLQKKRGVESVGDEPQLTKTEGRFETYTGKAGVSVSILFYSGFQWIVFE